MQTESVSPKLGSAQKQKRPEGRFVIWFYQIVISATQ